MCAGRSRTSVGGFFLCRRELVLTAVDYKQNENKMMIFNKKINSLNCKSGGGGGMAEPLRLPSVYKTVLCVIQRLTNLSSECFCNRDIFTKLCKGEYRYTLGFIFKYNETLLVIQTFGYTNQRYSEKHFQREMLMGGLILGKGFAFGFFIPIE